MPAPNNPKPPSKPPSARMRRATLSLALTTMLLTSACAAPGSDLKIINLACMIFRPLTLTEAEIQALRQAAPPGDPTALRYQVAAHNEVMANECPSRAVDLAAETGP